MLSKSIKHALQTEDLVLFDCLSIVVGQLALQTVLEINQNRVTIGLGSICVPGTRQDTATHLQGRVVDHFGYFVGPL
jgi:hypothetical protein